METEAAAQESLGLGKLGTQAEKDRRLKKKQVWRFSPWLFNFSLFFIIVRMDLKNKNTWKQNNRGWCYLKKSVLMFPIQTEVQFEMSINIFGF